MTDSKEQSHDIVDRIAAHIRDDSLDDATASAAVDRVWQRIASETGENDLPLRGCEDFRTLIPAFVAGSLPRARALLVEDHVGECVMCRRALMEARGHVVHSVDTRMATRVRRVPTWLRIAAAVIVVVGLGVVGVRALGTLLIEKNLVARVESPNGSLQLVSADAPSLLDNGATVRARQTVRADKASGAVLRLTDGTTIELDARSEVKLRGSFGGTIIDLERGNIIVQAAQQQQRRRLFVSTDDCLVAVRGTIFAVDHGLKGSRVSVIEGSVEVRQRGVRDILAPGEQITTNARLANVAVEEQIAWSRDAERHRALLRELTELHRDVADVMDPRTSRTATELLDLAPSDTVIYAAIPNMTDGLDEARLLLEERLASSELLQEWWQEQVVANGLDIQIDILFDRLQPLGEAVGDEVVFSVPASAIDHNTSPLVLASLDDPAGFSALLAEQVDLINHEAGQVAAMILDDPLGAEPAAAELYLWVDRDLFAAATSVSTLADLALRLTAPDAPTFEGTQLHTRLAQAYAEGVSWLLGVDAGALMSHGSAQTDPQGREMLERLGLLDVTTLVVERHRVDDKVIVNAELDFDGPRRGMASWLDAPSPMGSLEFFSPDAGLASAVVAKDSAVMFDELFAAVASVDPNATNELQALEDQLGFDLRADLAATLGGEAAFALDGPVLPVPSWKLVVEVYDAATLETTIARVVAGLNFQLEAHDRVAIEHVTETAGDLTYHTLRHADGAFEAVFTIVDGYLIMAPQRALIDQALQYRASEVTLARSALFQGLLPENGYTDCSALLYRNFGPILDAIPLTSQLSDIPPEMLDILQESADPGLVCVYGENDRILGTSTGGGLFNALPAAGLSSLMFHPPVRVQVSPEPVSSRG
jgi:hypothetical protein